MEIIWSHLSKITFFEILENLKEKWTRREISNFNSLVQENLQLIKNDYAIFPKTAAGSTV